MIDNALTNLKLKIYGLFFLVQVTNKIYFNIYKITILKIFKFSDFVPSIKKILRFL